MPDERDWLDRVSDELKRDVPVRPAWRAALLSRIGEEGAPAAGSGEGRRLSLSPLVAVAAALGFIVLGAAGTTLVLRGKAGSNGVVAGALQEAPVQQVRFQLDAPQARRVSLVGDFNGWDPSRVPMVRLTPGGPWAVKVSLPPGRHVYAFVVDGGVTPDPGAARAVEDDFGTPSSVLVVSAAVRQ